MVGIYPNIFFLIKDYATNNECVLDLNITLPYICHFTSFNDDIKNHTTIILRYQFCYQL